MSFEKSFSEEEEEHILEGFGSEDIRNYKTLNGKSNKDIKFLYDNIKDSQNRDKNNEKKIVIVTYKYSRMGKGELHEAAIVNDMPFFIKYNNITKEVELVETIEENRRILRPPEREEYPYTPYEFESKDELGEFINKANLTNLDELYNICKSFYSKYIDQDEHIITILTTDSIETHFQDLFPTTHYFEAVGTNDVGKSSIGYTFEYTAYRAVKATAISGPNYYRLLGTVEPGQCTIIEDEEDNISEDPDKVKIFKAGYEFDGKVPKINMNSKDQGQQWYYAYCYKMILAEKSLSQSKARGLVDRTFSGHCKPGIPRYSIKNIVNNKINKNPKRLKLYNELLEFRKLMLCYRLIHYKDSLPEIETGLKNRDNELCNPSLQLFYGTDSIKEIIPTLETFVKQRKERKLNSLEAALYPILKDMIDLSIGGSSDSSHSSQQQQQQKSIIKLIFSEIWSKIIQGKIDGNYDEKKPNQYETVDYGIIYKNTLSKLIADKFGATLHRKASGSILIFDLNKFSKFENIYDKVYDNYDDIGIDNNNDQSLSTTTNSIKIDVNRLEEIYDDNVGSEGTTVGIDEENVGSEGIRRCVSIRRSELYINPINEDKSNNTNILEPTQHTFCAQEFTLQSTQPTFLIMPQNFNNPLISKADLAAGNYDPHIINNIDRFEGTDRWFCNNCTMKDDKWFMMKHQCKNFYTQKKEKHL